MGLMEVFIVGLIGTFIGFGTASMVKPIVKRFYGEHLLGKAVSYVILLILVVWCGNAYQNEPGLPAKGGILESTTVLGNSNFPGSEVSLPTAPK